MADRETTATLCTMCEEAPATTTWGLPVCQPCADSLGALDGDLKAMEAEDPHLAELGRQVEEAAQRLYEAGKRRAKDRAAQVQALRSDESNGSQDGRS